MIVIAAESDSLSKDTGGPGNPPQPARLDQARLGIGWPAQGMRRDVKEDALDALIAASTAMLALPIEPDWKPAIKVNLAVTLRLAEMVEEFELPDAAEPASVFEA